MVKKSVLVVLLVCSFLVFLFGARCRVAFSASSLIIRVPDDHMTIQEAVDAADAGDVVLVSAGVYYEYVRVNKSVSLIGEDRETTIIDNDGSGTGCICATANNVRISGFTVQNGEGIVLKNSSGSVVYQNTLASNDFRGIWLDDSSGNMIIDNRISDNGGGIPPYISWGGGIEILNYSHSNIIRGNLVSDHVGFGIGIDKSCGNVVVHNTFQNNGAGVDLSSCSGNVVRDNVMTSNGGGVALDGGTSQNTIEHNQLLRNNGGIGAGYSRADIIKENNITENTVYGVALAETSTNITVVGNNISNNYRGILVHYSNGSIIHHNNLINNTKNAPEDVYPNINTWDDGYPSGGNYWSDYNGTDLYSGPYQNETGSDGIGDTSHTLDPRNQDRFPLMGPISFFHVGAWNKTACEIHIMSNSTITNFQLNKTEKRISFNVTGPDAMIGFCRITIPNIIVQKMWSNNYTILTDETTPLTTSNWTDDTYTYVYFTYIHSEHEIQILREFSATMALPLFIILILYTARIRRHEESARS